MHRTLLLASCTRDRMVVLVARAYTHQVFLFTTRAAAAVAVVSLRFIYPPTVNGRRGEKGAAADQQL